MVSRDPAPPEFPWATLTDIEEELSLSEPRDSGDSEEPPVTVFDVDGSDPPGAWLSRPCDQPGRACSWVASAACPVHTEEQTCSSDALPLPSANGASMRGVAKICAQILTIALL